MTTALQAQTRTAQLNLAAQNIREEATAIRESAESAFQSGVGERVVALAEQAVFHASRAADRCRSNPDLARAHLLLAEVANTAMIAASNETRTPALPTSAQEAVELLRRCDFRPFTQNDWHAYAGCEDRDPRIAEVGDMTIILSGPEASFMVVTDDCGIEDACFTLA